MHKPTEKHRLYLKHIGHYLKATKNNGLILKPVDKDKLSIECYVDANFTRLWNTEDMEDPYYIRSQTGYLVMVNRYPVIYKSKAQSLNTLITMESEYVTLLDSCQELLQFQTLTKEVRLAIGIPWQNLACIFSTIYEDNKPCLKLSNMSLPRIINWSIVIYFDWFCQNIGKLWNIVGALTIHQLANIFAKSLFKDMFEQLIFWMIGW